MLVHLCLSILFSVISLIVFICTITYELINYDDDDDLTYSFNSMLLSGCKCSFKTYFCKL